MPITRKYHLKDLLAACKAYPLRPWEKLTFEYVLLRGVNDTDADARRVVKLLANLNAKVNLIALNPGPGIPYETPDPERVASFQNIVRRALPCFIRKPRGLDIYAACGQLKRNRIVIGFAPHPARFPLRRTAPVGGQPLPPITLPARRNDFQQLLVPARIDGSPPLWCELDSGGGGALVFIEAAKAAAIGIMPTSFGRSAGPLESALALDGRTRVDAGLSRPDSSPSRNW